jgi:hypothetical protein
MDCFPANFIFGKHFLLFIFLLSDTGNTMTKLLKMEQPIYQRVLKYSREKRKKNLRYCILHTREISFIGES